MTHISERLLVQAHLDAKQPVQLTAQAQEAQLRAAIAAELKRRTPFWWRITTVIR